MAAQRKVRKDFDIRKKYRVDVTMCSEKEKEEVQQAFFDVGLLWGVHGEKYSYLDANTYTNTTYYGEINPYLLYCTTTNGCNMTAKEFLDLVYEPEQQGHVHAELMARYAEDAKTHPEPWKLWQMKTGSLDWVDCKFSPAWDSIVEYRRKPKTHIVHGVDIPDLRIEPKKGDRYYLADPTEEELNHCYTYAGDSCDQVWTSRRLCYEHTEEGKQAAILHAKSMLGITGVQNL